MDFDSFPLTLNLRGVHYKETINLDNNVNKLFKQCACTHWDVFYVQYKGAFCGFMH